MKKSSALFILFFGLLVAAQAQLALVYKSEADVRSGKPIVGLVTAEGIVISAQDLMAAQLKPLAGFPGQDLRATEVVRFDNNANLALIRLVAPVSDADLLKAHQKNSEAALKFVTFDSLPVPSTATAVVQTSTEPFVLFINGISVDEAPIVLKKKRKQGEFLLEVKVGDISPVWRVTVRLQSAPDLSFWKKGQERRGLNDIPEKKFYYSHQLLFNQLSKGESLKVPLEVFGIKGADYEFTVKIESKSGDIEKKFAVRFEDKK